MYEGSAESAVLRTARVNYNCTIKQEGRKA